MKINRLLLSSVIMLICVETLFIMPNPLLAAPPFADIVLVVDVSGSMHGEHRWISTMIISLEAKLLDAGIGTKEANQYTLVAFGEGPRRKGKVSRTGGWWVPAAQLSRTCRILGSGGDNEDGWSAIDFFFKNYRTRDNAVLNIILITDEDRDILNPGLTFNGVLRSLKNGNALLNVVVNHGFVDATQTKALGVDCRGNAYLSDGSGGFKSSPGGAAASGTKIKKRKELNQQRETIKGGYVVLASCGSRIKPDKRERVETTKADYVDLAWATGGAAWDLNQLRAGGLIADSFTKAFVNIKVQEMQQEEEFTIILETD